MADTADEKEYLEVLTLKMIDAFLRDKEFSNKVKEIQIYNKKEMKIKAGYKIPSDTNHYADELDVISTSGCIMSDIFTRYDAMVLNAVSTLFERGYETFSPHTVYRVMRGRNDYNTIPVKKLEEVRDSIQKLRQMLVSMDLRKQLPGIKKPDMLQGIYIDANVLQLECSYRADTQNIKYSIDICWSFLPTTTDGKTKEPILRQYARATSQLLEMPTRLIREGAEINKSNEVIALRIHLYKNIRWIKSGYRNSKYLRFETIMNDLQISMPKVDRPDKAYKRFCNRVISIIDIFIKCGVVRAYEVIYKYKFINQRQSKVPYSIKIDI